MLGVKKKMNRRPDVSTRTDVSSQTNQEDVIKTEMTPKAQCEPPPPPVQFKIKSSLNPPAQLNPPCNSSGPAAAAAAPSQQVRQDQTASDNLTELLTNQAAWKKTKPSADRQHLRFG